MAAIEYSVPFRVIDQSLPDGRAAGKDVHHARWQVALCDDLGERRFGGWLPQT